MVLLRRVNMAAMLLVVMVAVAAFAGEAAAQCTAHDECAEDEYCDALGGCFPCTTCVVYHDSITGACPVCSGGPAAGISCTTHEQCFTGRQYCDSTGGCFACQGCLILDDGVDNTCPDWCTPDSTTTSTTNPRVILGSSTGPAYSGSGSSSHGTEIAVGVVGCVVVVVAVVVAGWYVRRMKRSEEKNFVDMTRALAAKEQARGSILALSVRRDQQRQSQLSILAQQQQSQNQRRHSQGMELDEHGEYIDVEGLHRSHTARAPAPMDQQLYDDEFLELAREIGVATDA
ncbi:hypothetical protein PTSG_06344 [Salpingoeca rosetta]|uniref:TNFR-Cys domain-containing protein n=1 Tax=Salpingoeca rosetta (strain ATCC 50818 / BSB-021) TaxID=946362 RepID=F2UCM7_SALR5|nr:uncharacterized protein PTSG_06344 [Salpingoeca rosetta]EGD74334.1 hypothetical protein PTSG_06344 [Salpingoeca rosetta]|eukprot:XP_004993234.1 hypothetical protein PTSG_06344 [Salpingoeca rosetta]